MNQTKHNTKHNGPSDTRRKDLAKIHIAKKQLGMDDTTYREMLWSVARVKSAADLDEQGRSAAIEHLKACGFRPTHKSAKAFKSAHKSARASGMHRPPARARAPLLSKIGAILAELKLPWNYADGMARRMFGVEKARWLNPRQLYKLTAALIYHQQRVRKRKEG